MTESVKKHGKHQGFPDTNLAPRDFWNELYAQREQVWSGRVNATLAAVLEPLEPGRVLDLGCGEGADVVWLAEQGWQAVGIDISDTAIERAQAAACARGLGESARFIATDLSTWTSQERFDVIISSFLQSPVELERERILGQALELLAPRGRLIALSHAAPPPWVEFDPDFHRFPDPLLEAAVLAPAGSEFEVLQAGTVQREVKDPSGDSAIMLDGLLVIARR